MRLLVIQPTADRHGHFGIWTTRLCQALSEVDTEVTLVTNKIDPSRYLSTLPSFRIVQIGNERYSFAGLDDQFAKRRHLYYYAYFRNSRAILSAALQLTRYENFDGIFLTDTEFMTASLVLRGWHGALPPILLESHAANFSFASYEGNLFEKAYKAIQREVFRTALGNRISAIGVLGEWARDELRSQLRLSSAFPIEIVPDAGGVVEASPERDVARKALGIDFEGTVFLFFGMWRKEKGIDLLLEAAAQMRNREFRLVIAGAPRDYEPRQLAEAVTKLGLESQVILRPGYVADEDVANYFRACDGLVLPYSGSYRGGSGPLLKGACAYGRPAIVSNVAIMGQLVTESNMGLAFAPDNQGQLVTALERFLSSTQEERSIMEANSKRLAQVNSWESVANRIVDIFSRLGQQRLLTGS
ncbi:MAG: glycosyltransferase family 4 protein [Actinomycetota bacterium]